MFERLFLKPWFGGVNAVVGIFAGYLGSVYANEIQATLLQSALFPGHAFDWKSTVFWVVAAVFGASFTGTFWAQQRSANRSSQRLEDATKDIDVQTTALTHRASEIATDTSDLLFKTHQLEQLVLQLYTLPPQGFLQVFRGQFEVAFAAHAIAVDPESTREELEAAVRTQLLCVLELASRFDDDGKDARYGVNVMLFHDQAEIAYDKQAAAIKERLRFVDPDVTIRDLRGFLDLKLPLSVASGSGAEPDAQLQPLALPIPKSEKDRYDDYLLPGAPMTYATGQAWVFEAEDDIKAVAAQAQFSNFVKDELKAFFAARSGVIKSFLCFPIRMPPWIEGGRTFGVLNVHRNLENPLAAERVQLLAPILDPFLVLLGESVAEWRAPGAGATVAS